MRTGRWLGPSTRCDGVRARLFCLPQAGSGASFFQPWVDASSGGLQVCALQPPGRETRLGERPFTNIEELAASAAAELIGLTDVSYALCGHSLGALAAYEIAREIVRCGGPMPVHLFVSGRRGPGVPALTPPIHEASDEAFALALRTVYKAPTRFLDNDRLVAAFLPLLRADFIAGETYEHPVDAAPLTCPITAFAGVADPVAPPTAMETWRRCTTSLFSLSAFDGDHAFWQRESMEIYAAVRQMIGGRDVLP